MYFVLILIATIHLFEVSCFSSPLVRVFRSGREHGGAPPHLTIFFNPPSPTKTSAPPTVHPPHLKMTPPHLKNNPPLPPLCNMKHPSMK